MSSGGLDLGALARTQVHVRGIGSDAAWYGFSFFYKQLFDCKAVQCKTQANFHALMQSNAHVHAKVLALSCLLSVLSEISPGIGNYPGNQGSETVFTNDLTVYLQLY